MDRPAKHRKRSSLFIPFARVAHRAVASERPRDRLPPRRKRMAGQHESGRRFRRLRGRTMASAVVALVVVAVWVGVDGAPAAAATGSITGYGGKCVDVNAANTANGTQIQLYTCNATNAQTWTVGTDGTVRALGKCMDVAAAGTPNRTK